MIMLHKYRDLSLHEFWEKYMPTVERAYPEVAKLAKVMLLVPMQTACCERAFSKMSIIKTDHRNRMGEELLDACMKCSIGGPSLQ
jgi:hypothetical protein